MIVDVFGIATFDRFFRAAASLDADKDDLRRFDDFVDDLLYVLLLRGVANAEANRTAASTRPLVPR
jgi:hypothetical protein